MYAAYSERFGWQRIDNQIDNKASSKATKEIKTECLWFNYEHPAAPSSGADQP
jgi:hypothetical protein